MINDIQKLFISLLMSLFLYAGTEYWYRKTQISYAFKGNDLPVAYVDTIKSLAQRKPASRTLWLPLSENNELFSGEYVKTDSDAELRIRFADSNRYLDLEPDSQVLLTRSQNEISLNLEKGSIMVTQNNQETSGPSLTLQSGNKKVDLTRATAMLSKNEDQLSLQVIKGKAQIQSEEGQNQEVTSGKVGTFDQESFNPSELQILSPTVGQIHWIHAQSPQPVAFAWKGFPENSNVKVWVGPTRKKMRQQDGVKVQIPAGKYYWKLVSTNSENKIVAESLIYSLEVKSLPLPVILSPAMGAQFEIKNNPYDVPFQWSSTLPHESAVLEISKNENLSEPVLQKNLGPEYSYLHAFSEGKYFWRLTTRFKNIDTPISSPILSFTVSLPPKIPVVITWQPRHETTPQYFVNDPLLTLLWSPDKTQQTHFWRIKVAADETNLRLPNSESMMSQTITETTAKFKVPGAGRYVATVEALDQHKNVLATSEVKQVQVAALPLLPAPRFAHSENVLLSDKNGNIHLKWSSVTGAKEYILKVTSPLGTSSPIRLTQSTYSFVDLEPGDYQIEIKSVDEFGRESQNHDQRSITVPNESTIQAPTFRRKSR